jgi:hypothetical protein
MDDTTTIAAWLTSLGVPGGKASGPVARLAQDDIETIADLIDAELTEKDLEKMGVSLLLRRKMVRGLDNLKTGEFVSASASVTQPEPGAQEKLVAVTEADTVFSRIQDVMAEDGEVRSPIASPFPSDREVADTLAEALQDVSVSNDPDVKPDRLAQMIKIAEAHALHPALAETQPYSSMAVARRASIVLYSMQDAGDVTQSVFHRVNAALRARDRTAVKPWSGYIWLLMNALAELPGEQVNVVFRGCNNDVASLPRSMVEKGHAPFVWSSFSSSATTMDVMKTFVGKEVTLPGCLLFCVLFLCPPDNPLSSFTGKSRDVAGRASWKRGAQHQAIFVVSNRE